MANQNSSFDLFTACPTKLETDLKNAHKRLKGTVFIVSEKIESYKKCIIVVTTSGINYV